MSLPVVWSNYAELTFDSIVDFIESSWGTNSARKFIRRVNHMLSILAQHPYMFKFISSVDDVRIGLITPQVSVVYKIHHDHIYLLYFWDNRQQPIT